MRTFVALSLAALLASAAPASAQERLVLKAPTIAQAPEPILGEPVSEAPPLVVPEGVIIPEGAPGFVESLPVAPIPPLYHNVRYKDVKKVEACFTPLIVEIQDPCWKRRSHACVPALVAVEIRVPCGEPRIATSHNGRRLKYDYGKFEVEITSRNGLVTVDYD